MRLVGKPGSRGNAGEWSLICRDQGERAVCPCLQAELGRCDTEDFPESARDCRRRKIIFLCPLVQGETGILEQVVGKHIRPVVVSALDWVKLRTQLGDRLRCIALGGAHYDVWICDTTDADAGRESFNEKIEDLSATTAEAIQVCVESIVKEYVPWTDAEAPPAAALFI